MLLQSRLQFLLENKHIVGLPMQIKFVQIPDLLFSVRQHAPNVSRIDQLV